MSSQFAFEQLASLRRDAQRLVEQSEDQPIAARLHRYGCLKSLALKSSFQWI